jgi:hypothetical protein
MKINNARDEAHEQMMRMLCRFFGVQEATYIEGKTGEGYVFKNQEGNELTLRVCSAPEGGRYFIVMEGSSSFEEEEERPLQEIKKPDTRYPHC